MRYLSFPLFTRNMVYFSMVNSIRIFWLYILIVCIRICSSFFIFCKQLNVIHFKEVVNLFM